MKINGLHSAVQLVADSTVISPSVSGIFNLKFVKGLIIKDKRISISEWFGVNY